MKLLNTRFWLICAAALALVLPAASEPLFWYVEEDVVEQNNGNEQFEMPTSVGMTEEGVVPGENRPVMAAGVQNNIPSAARSPRAGAVVPIAQQGGAKTQQIISRQPNFASTGPQGRNVQQRGNAQNRSAVPANQQINRSAVQPRTAINRSGTQPSRNVASRGGTQSGRTSSLAPAGLTRAQTAQGSNVNTARAMIAAQPAQGVSTSTSSTAYGTTPARTPVYRSTTALTTSGSMIDKNVADRQELENLKVASEIAQDKAELLMQIDDACLAQYYGCMDDICSNVNDLLGRCACSPSADAYKQKTEELKQVNWDLQDAVRNIQYLGLTADEVESLFTKTEAEHALEYYDFGAGNNAETRLREMIIEIRDRDVMDLDNLRLENATSKSSFTGGFGMGFGDMGSMDIWDIGDIFGGNTKRQFNDIANMTGKDLYNATKQKCEYILKDCAKKKVDIEVIQAKYDVEIGKACVYIRDDLEEQINAAKTLTRNARTILERARFQVAQNKNLYDLKDCVVELDRCMTDEFVCGKDYKRCVDGTGKYISADGKDVVPGADLALMQFHLWGGSRNDVNYQIFSGMAAKMSAASGFTTYSTNMPFCDNGTKTGAKVACNGTLTTTSVTGVVNTNNALVVQMLASKIGVITSGTSASGVTTAGQVSSGFCAHVMRQCQRYSYTDDTYNPNNDVVRNYLYQALPKIMTAQNRFVADFQTQCVSDLQSCYTRQLQSFGVGSYYGSQSTAISGTLLRTLMSACDSIGLSCAYAVYNDSDNFRMSNGTTAATACTTGTSSCCRIPTSVNCTSSGGDNPVTTCSTTTIDGTYATAPKPLQCLGNISSVALRGVAGCSGTSSALNTCLGHIDTGDSPAAPTATICNATEAVCKFK